MSQPPAPELPCSSKAPVWVLLCSVKDPGNLGSIIRTCYYLGVSRLIITGSRCQLSSVVSKSSAGTLEIFPVFSVRDSRTWVRGLQQDGWRVLAADIPDCPAQQEEEEEEEGEEEGIERENYRAKPNVSLDQLQFTVKPTLLGECSVLIIRLRDYLSFPVLGSEGGGIPPDLLAEVQETVSISSCRFVDPLLDSLNVSVAAAIIIHSLCSHFRDQER